MSWRRKQVDAYSPHNPRTKLQSREPQHHQDCWQLGAPYWEKQFCLIVGSVPWRRVVETKKDMHLYESIVQWNDSANLETFNNEKYRFWAAINGLSCNISLPDPDMYIDDIDWNSSIDPELILDLEREPEPSNDESQDKGVTVGNPLLLDQSLACIGWGDAEDDLKNNENPANWGSGWGAAEEDLKNKENPANWGCGWGDAEVDFKNKENPANWGSGWGIAEEDFKSIQNHANWGYGWGIAEEDFKSNQNHANWGYGWSNAEVDFKNKENPENWGCGWNADNKENPRRPDSTQTQSKAAVGGWDNSWNNNWDNNLSKWKNNIDASKNMHYGRADGASWGNSNGNGRKKDGGSWYNSRHKTSRVQGDYYQKNEGWRNGGRRNNRDHVGYENLA
ncbi:uncharacterized protein LOC126593804 [Malus sylvestris]|uniref:uncharacterized protein LOC126593804 n=1 Tax=Malus sylvestris TaxID=3752 RepID=UPI0021ABF666|nr:uncharacterized protein LOC126593804 [Malus sylvestris]